MFRKILITIVLLAIIALASVLLFRQLFVFVVVEEEQGSSETVTTETDVVSAEAATNNVTPTAEQQDLLDKYNVDTDKITPEMVACAEEKLGADRVAEIKDGATPFVSESLKLLTCYATN